MKRIYWLIFALAVAMLCQGCDFGKKKDRDIPQEYPLTINNVRITQRPNRVISLSPTLTEIIYELGNESQLAGRSDYCDFPQQALQLPSFGTAWIPDNDKIKDFMPDLIVTQQPLPDETMQMLQLKGINVLVIESKDSMDKFSQVYIDLGAALGGDYSGRMNGRETANRIDAKLRDIRVKVKPFSDNLPVTVCYIASPQGDIATDDTLIGSLLEMAGGINVAGEGTGYKFDQDTLLLAAPQVIFCPKGLAAEIKENSAYKDLPAVLNDRVYEVEAVALERQTSRMAEVVSYMAQILYPEAFEQLSRQPENQ